ncbi:MAG: HigA family addiction module antitoxin [Prosthecobacter sp.]|jgi:addiction module HigA family antidote
MKRLKNIHPGEVLLEDFLKPLGISQYRLAVACGLPHSRITDIVKGRRGISADTALRLAKALGTSADLWLGLQKDFDVEEASREYEKTYRNIPLLAHAA